MPESIFPLLKGNSILNVAYKYETLLEIKVDPKETLYVGNIKIATDDVTGNLFINVKINGTPYLTEFPVLNATTTIGFGRQLKLTKCDKPLEVEVKKTAAGITGTVKASAFVTGIKDD